MKKLLILSGKGGTGKTTTAAAFLRFSKAQAAADCDVDAPNLHLVLNPEEEPEQSVFYGSEKSSIDPGKCIGCGKCAQLCRFDAIRRRADGKYEVVDYACEGCGVCNYVCPQGAASMHPDEAGELALYRGETVFSTAKLKMGRGNSGKLVTQVKFAMAAAAQKAKKQGIAIIDGSPGIGCPVIASVSGVDLVLIVAEPSLSGISDMKRVLHTADMLGSRAAVCINKYNTSPERTAEIEEFCARQKIPFVGKVPYDPAVSGAVNAGKSIADYDCPARSALYDVYRNTVSVLEMKA